MAISLGIHSLVIPTICSIHCIPPAPLAALSAANAVSDLELRVPRELRAFSAPAVAPPGAPGWSKREVFPTKNGGKVWESLIFFGGNPHISWDFLEKWDGSIEDEDFLWLFVFILEESGWWFPERNLRQFGESSQIWIKNAWNYQWGCNYLTWRFYH